LRTSAVLAGLVFALTSASASADEALRAWQDAALIKVRTEYVFKAFDASFPEPDRLRITVRDNGSRRDKLAHAICLSLDMMHYPPQRNILIEIVDIRSADPAKPRELGRFDCQPPG
jgi:hypothetical protein